MMSNVPSLSASAGSAVPKKTNAHEGSALLEPPRQVGYTRERRTVGDVGREAVGGERVCEELR